MRKTLIAFAMLAAASAYAGEKTQNYVATPENTKQAIGSCANPVVIQAFNQAGGEAAERAYLSGHHVGYTWLSQRGATCNGKAAYRVKIRTADGKKTVVFFDASGWAGKN